MTRRNMKRTFLAPHSPWHYVLALTLGFAIVGWYAASLAHIRYHYSPDSAVYIETARSLANGTLPILNAPIVRQDLAATPLALFPPGLPLLIYSVSAISGMNESLASVGINWIAWALLPAILLFALRPVANVWAAHLVGVLVCISPGVTQTGWLAHSDIPFLFLIISSFGLLLRGCAEPGRPTLLLLSGVTCGLAYLTRNAGVALIAATISTFALLALARVLTVRTTLTRFTYWLIGTGLILAPFLAWNLNVFGAFHPYQMPPSDISLLTNIRTFLQALILDTFAAPSIALLAWEGKALMIMAMLILVATWLARTHLSRAWNGSAPNTKLALLFLGTYLGLGSAMVVIARTRYQWGETIHLRHVLQYSWALFAGMALLVGAMRSKSANGLAVVIALTLIGSRLVYGDTQRAQELDTYNSIAKSANPLLAARMLPNRGTVITNKLKLLVAQDASLLATIRDYPDSVVLVSNLADVFQIKTGRMVRALEFGSDCNLARSLDIVLARLPTTVEGIEIRVLISPNNEMLRSGCWDQLRDAELPGFRSTFTQPNMLVLASDPGQLRLKVSANPRSETRE